MKRARTTRSSRTGAGGFRRLDDRRDLLTALLSILIVAACGGGPDGDAPGLAVAEPVVIELERTACLGTCPAFSLRLETSGSVRYEGFHHVQEVGERSGTIDSAVVRRLAGEIVDAGFMTWDEEYRFGGPHCPDPVTDLPSTRLSVEVGQRARRVVIDHGCAGAPDAIHDLAERVERAAGSERWVGSGGS